MKPEEARLQEVKVIRPCRKHVSRVRHFLSYTSLVLLALVLLIPFYFVINASLKTDAAVQAGDYVSLPKSREDLQWKNYPKALGPDHLDFKPALANTVFVTTLCVIGQVLSCSLVGYGFARFQFRGRTVLFMVMLSTLMLPAQVTMIPVFVLFRGLGMVDSFWPLILPAWLASPFFVFMFRQFFTQIPEELIEAARIDGASYWRVYWQLMLPLSGPVYTDRPPMPIARVGYSSFITQAHTSRKWTCCSTLKSPESQVKLYQLRIWYVMSDQSGRRGLAQRPLR